MRIFDYRDYKKFVNEKITQSPKKGRGEYARLAEVAQTHKATISQIFKGPKHLTGEQAVRVGKYLNLLPGELHYFVLLVSYERAGSEDLRLLYKKQINQEIENNRDLSQRLVKSRELTEEERAVFYSSWIYSAVRVLSSIPGFQARNEIAQRLRLPPELVDQVLEMLLKNGLCVENKGKINPGPQSTYLHAKSPLVSRHHGNWRIKAMERHPTLRSQEELSYTAPLSLSSDDVVKIREILAATIEKADEVVAPSKCERFYCLNVDWFEVF